MAVSWTDEQQKVIDLRNRNLLVSAAAGSGKTAVLVERIISRIQKDNPPIGVDELLVVTFTEAAAAEMRERIGRALGQVETMHTAKIMTIHSFCLSVIKEYFHTIDLDPGFRVAEEGELKLVKADVVEELLEEKYEEGSSEFLQFVESFATGRDDTKLEEMILRLYEYAGAYPDPEAWLDGCALSYENALDEESIFMKKLMPYVKNSISDLLRDMDFAVEICESMNGPAAYLDTIAKDRVIVETLTNPTTYMEFCHAFQNLENWPRLASCRDKSVDPDKLKMVKDLREVWKKKVSEIQKSYFEKSPEEQKEDLNLCLPVIQVLVQLVKEFGNAFAKKKAEKNMIDFHDMEQFALKILTQKEDGKFVPTEVAKAYQKQFAEIMVDEYQDSNYLQETILTSVSRMSQGENNMFMVGDVKQSIYRFRLSRPDLFMEKYDTYSLEDGSSQRIDLHKNFRSRAEVLDATNSIFRQVMTKDLGGIEYDENAALYVGANYEEMSGNVAELLIVDTAPEADGAQMKVSVEEARELEIKAVAQRIHRLMEEQVIWDKHAEAFRPVQYKDIVLLSRSLRGYSDVIIKTFAEEGIPVYAESKEGYFETLEISWILDYLRVLDNYRQDIPLTAVLKSPFGNCTNEELAQIRRGWENVPFHEAVLRTAGICWEEEAEMSNPIPEKTVKKVKCIFHQMETFRKMVSYTSIQELLWKIVKETGYQDYISAMPGGEQRSANLDMLFVKAKTFEKTSYKGLFHFVRYMDQVKKYELDTGEAGIFNEQTDAVRLMSIHKSKGLEFPVVIVCGMGKQFNTQDTKQSVVLHPDLGIGIDAIDVERRTKATTIVKEIIRNEEKLESLGEELRVLYVAMTRAKEKLILAGTYANVWKAFEEFADIPKNENGTLTYSRLVGANRYFDWVLPAAASVSEMVIERNVVCLDDILVAEVLQEEEAVFEKQIFLSMLEQGEEHTKQKAWVQEQLDYVYPFREEQLKMKYSVSELKHQAMEETAGETAEELFKEQSAYVPSFIKKEEELTGASRGSAFHKVMELLDFTKIYTSEGLKEEIEHLKEEGYLDAEMAACIHVADVMYFLSSDAGKRMHEAAKAGKLFKEQPFVMGVDAKTFYPESESEELVLIQGIIDVFWEEDGALVVLDYKTDKVWKTQQLVDKYQEQLHLYGKALQQMTEKPVKEKVIYSFTLREEIVL